MSERLSCPKIYSENKDGTFSTITLTTKRDKSTSLLPNHNLSQVSLKKDISADFIGRKRASSVLKDPTQPAFNEYGLKTPVRLAPLKTIERTSKVQ